MALRRIWVTLSVVPESGRFTTKKVLSTLKIAASKYKPFEQNRAGGALGIAIFDLSCEAFTPKPKKGPAETDWEAYTDSINKAWRSFSKWLAKIKRDDLSRLRELVGDVYILTNLWIDCDQMDLDLPPELLVELGRLQLRLHVLSNE